ncbi:ATP-binding protein [Streptomyces sp. CA-106110]|uniref:ATP-binding protein n=1 Tax=Streptomyces sp. CA-106110 TaxID=3240044 RepID=UPI003D8C3722
MANLLGLTNAPAVGVRATTRSNTGHLAIDLDVMPETVPIIRTIVRAHLQLWGLHELIDPAALTVSELLANVLKHARPDTRSGSRNAQLTVTRLPEALNVCVRDFDPAPPKLSPVDDAEEDGRGLHLVIAVADDFGCSPVTGGKDVWANFLINNSQANLDRR